MQATRFSLRLGSMILLSSLACCGDDKAAGPPDNGIPDLFPPPMNDDDVVRDAAVGLERSRTRLIVMLEQDAGASRCP